MIISPMMMIIKNNILKITIITRIILIGGEKATP